VTGRVLRSKQVSPDPVRKSFNKDLASLPICAFFVPQGEGVAGAKVYVDGRAVSRTDETGSYQLFNITTGTYIIQVSVYPETTP